MLPKSVVIVYYRGHQKENTVVAKGKWNADTAAKQAALQESFLATLVPDSGPLSTPTYIERKGPEHSKRTLSPCLQDDLKKSPFSSPKPPLGSPKILT